MMSSLRRLHTWKDKLTAEVDRVCLSVRQIKLKIREMEKSDKFAYMRKWVVAPNEHAAKFAVLGRYPDMYNSLETEIIRMLKFNQKLKKDVTETRDRYARSLQDEDNCRRKFWEENGRYLPEYFSRLIPSIKRSPPPIICHFDDEIARLPDADMFESMREEDFSMDQESLRSDEEHAIVSVSVDLRRSGGSELSRSTQDHPEQEVASGRNSKSILVVEEQLSSAQHQLNTLMSELTSEKKLLTETRDELQNCRQENIDLKSKISELIEKLNNNETSVAVIKNDFKHTTENWLTESNNLRAELSSKTDCLHTTEKELEWHRSLLATERADWISERNKLCSQLQTVETNAAEIKQELVVSNEKLIDCESKWNSEKKSLLQSIAELSGTVSEQQQLNASTITLGDQITELKWRCDTLRRSLRDGVDGPLLNALKVLLGDRKPNAEIAAYDESSALEHPESVVAAFDLLCRKLFDAATEVATQLEASRDSNQSQLHSFVELLKSSSYCTDSNCALKYSAIDIDDRQLTFSKVYELIIASLENFSVLVQKQRHNIKYLESEIARSFSSRKISFRNFSIGDLALFFPIKPKDDGRENIYVALHEVEGQRLIRPPKYVISEDSPIFSGSAKNISAPKFRPYLIGEILMMWQFICKKSYLNAPESHSRPVRLNNQELKLCQFFPDDQEVILIVVRSLVES